MGGARGMLPPSPSQIIVGACPPPLAYPLFLRLCFAKEIKVGSFLFASSSRKYPLLSTEEHILSFLSRKENPQKLTQFSSRSHRRHLVGKRTAQKDTIIEITSDSQVNSNFPYRWSPASLTFTDYFTFSIFIYNVNNHK